MMATREITGISDMALNSIESKYEIMVINPEFVEQNINSFCRIAADIPHEKWVLENYLYDLPDKWLNSIALINKISGELAGFIIASTKEKVVHIHKYAVDPAYRSHGFGDYLLNSLEQILKDRGLQKISLYIDPQNTGARKFYERNEFIFISDHNGMCYFEKQISLVIAIHQPNFFPWLGYFDKIIRSDIFVFLDDSQLQKTGGSWSNRVQLAIAGEAKWFTAPINRNFRGTATINNITFDEKVPWRDKLIKSLELNYRKAPFYNEAIAFLKSVINYPEQNVALYNSYCVRAILDQLNIKSNLVVASGLNITENATERLVVITQKLGANIYLCGGGAGGYQEDHLFPEAGLGLKYQDFKPAAYDQNGKGKFIPGLSIIDVIMHCGFGGTRQLLYNET